jgi:hypothetical protein
MSRNRTKRLAAITEEFSTIAQNQSHALTLNTLPSHQLFVVDRVGGKNNKGGIVNDNNKRKKGLSQGQLKQVKALIARGAHQQLQQQQQQQSISSTLAAQPYDIWTSSPNNNTAPKIKNDNSNKRVKAIKIPLPGGSYNPSAQDHVDALKVLAKQQEKVLVKGRQSTTTTTSKTDVTTPQSSKDTTTTTSSTTSSKTDDNVVDNEKDDDEIQSTTSSTTSNENNTNKNSKQSYPKTTSQRRRESIHRALQSEHRRIKEEKQQETLLDRAKSLAKLADQQVQQHELTIQQRQEQEKQRKSTLEPVIRIGGKRVNKTDPMTEIVAPSQLPDTLRQIPGVGGLILDEYTSLLSRKKFVLGGPKKATFHRNIKVKEKKFDLEKHRVGEPQFKRKKMMNVE